MPAGVLWFGTSYSWYVEALNAAGSAITSAGPASFSTAPSIDPYCSVDLGCYWDDNDLVTYCYSAPAAAGTLCRPMANACDIADKCDGIHEYCPADAKLSPAACSSLSAPASSGKSFFSYDAVGNLTSVRACR